jgi:hypothetical protein
MSPERFAAVRDRFTEEDRADRLRHLERQNEFLRGERARLEFLLGLACRCVVAGTGVAEGAFLEALCELADTDPAKAAFLDERERARAPTETDVVLRVLQETA